MEKIVEKLLENYSFAELEQFYALVKDKEARKDLESYVLSCKYSQRHMPTEKKSLCGEEEIYHRLMELAATLEVDKLPCDSTAQKTFKRREIHTVQQALLDVFKTDAYGTVFERMEQSLNIVSDYLGEMCQRYPDVHNGEALYYLHFYDKKQLFEPIRSEVISYLIVEEEPRDKGFVFAPTSNVFFQDPSSNLVLKKIDESLIAYSFVEDLVDKNLESFQKFIMPSKKK